MLGLHVQWNLSNVVTCEPIIFVDSRLSLVDHETAIMHRLQEVVLEHTPLLLSVMEHSAELDW